MHFFPLITVQSFCGWQKKKLSATKRHPRSPPPPPPRRHSVRCRLWLTGSGLTCAFACNKSQRSPSLRTTAFNHPLVPVHRAFCVCLYPANYGKRKLRCGRVNINPNNHTAESTRASSREMSSAVWCTNTASASIFSTSVSPDNSAHLPVLPSNVALICSEMKRMLHLGKEGLKCGGRAVALRLGIVHFNWGML